MRKPLIVGAALAAGAATFALLGAGAGAQSGGPPEIRAVPVHKQAVAPGVRLTVHVFPAANKNRRPSPSGDICTNNDAQTQYALFARAKRDGLAFSVSNRFSPLTAAPNAIGRSFGTWNSALSAAARFTWQNNNAAPTGPALDGHNVVGWARLVPKNTLAAAWVYTDASNRVIQADIFFNTSHTWGVLSGCNSSSAFDVENVGTHEVGHVLGLDHVSDPERQATMYPSAPAGEVRKRSLTAGDTSGAAAALQ